MVSCSSYPHYGTRMAHMRARTMALLFTLLGRLGGRGQRRKWTGANEIGERDDDVCYVGIIIQFPRENGKIYDSLAVSCPWNRNQQKQQEKK